MKQDTNGYSRVDPSGLMEQKMLGAKDNEGTSTAVAERMKRQVTRDSIREKSGTILH